MPFDCEDEEMWEAATYALVPLAEERWKIPDRSGKLLLVLHEDLKSRAISGPGSSVTSEGVHELACRFGRNKREMILEWVRLNLDDLTDYFGQVRDDPGLARFPGSCYVEGRMIFRRVIGRAAQRVPSIDERRVVVAKKEVRDVEGNINRLIEHRDEVDKRLSVLHTRLHFYQQKAADRDDVWPTLSWRGQIPESAAQNSAAKFSRNDFRAFDFKEGCDRGDVVRRPQVDPVRWIEISEGNPCEPPKKKRKRSKGGKALASSRKAPVPEAWVQEEEDFYDLQLRADSAELSGFQ